VINNLAEDAIKAAGLPQTFKDMRVSLWQELDVLLENTVRLMLSLSMATLIREGFEVLILVFDLFDNRIRNHGRTKRSIYLA
jgi:hypothetical protein